MLKYSDYFSRRILFNSQISLQEKLPIKSENEYIGADREQKIKEDMSKILSSFVNAFTKNNVENPLKQAQEFGIDKKIVSAFYDSGVISAEERDFFKNQDLFAKQEKEKISVFEAQEQVVNKSSAKVEPSKQVPVRSVKQ